MFKLDEENKIIMSKQQQYLLRKLSPYNWTFSFKLLSMFVIFLLVITGVTLKIEFNFFKNHVVEANYEKLAQLSDIKKKVVEDKYRYFQNDFKKLVNSDITYELSSLISEFNGFDVWGQTTTAEQSKDALNEYYHNIIIDQISWKKPELDEVFPKDEKLIAYQNKYLVEETKPDVKAFLRSFVRKYPINNIYIVDSEKGNVVYSLNRNIVLGTNLFTGEYSNSQLAISFQKALSEDKSKMAVTDFTHFIPNLNKPVSFIALPVFDFTDKVAVIILEIEPKFFEKILFDKWMYAEDETISFSLIGKDHLLRTNEISQLRSPEIFFNSMISKGRRNLSYQAVSDLGSSALILGFDKALELDKPKSIKTKDYLKERVYINSNPIELYGYDWILIIQSDIVSGVFSYSSLALKILIAFIVFFVFALICIRRLSVSMTGRLLDLDQAMEKTAHGEDPGVIRNHFSDELGHTLSLFCILKDRILRAGNFAVELSKGDYSTDFEKVSDDDSFANSLNTLKKTLKDSKEAGEKRDYEDKIVAWTNDGIVNFNDLLRRSNDNIGELSYLIIENLIDYLGAIQGGVFLVEGDEENEKIIKLVASYAYDRRKYSTKTIEIGEGLIGNCYLEKKPIHLKQIPQDYIEVTSGLGKTNPSVLYIVPLMMDDQVLGFIELAALEEIEDYKIQFINKLSDNIAATFSTVKLNTRTSELLEESKRRANEIAQQEEEMRQNMEEMQATQEELSRIRDEDEKRTNSLKEEIEAAHRMIRQLLNSMDGEILLKDSDGVIVLANEEAGARFNTAPDKLRGMSISDIYTVEKAQRESELDTMVLKDGLHSEEVVELVGKESVKYFIIRKQFYLPNRKEQGILTIRNRRS